jgi:hypothetical protein
MGAELRACSKLPISDRDRRPTRSSTRAFKSSAASQNGQARAAACEHAAPAGSGGPTGAGGSAAQPVSCHTADTPSPPQASPLSPGHGCEQLARGAGTEPAATAAPQ